MIGIKLVIIVISLILSAPNWASPLYNYWLLNAGLASISVFFLILVSKGLKQRRMWVAAIFALHCFFGFFCAIVSGLNLENLLNLANAILQGVAFYGLITGFSSTKTATDKITN